MARALVVGSLVFLLALARSMMDGIGLGDESWFLQVVARLRAGEVLYRDVFLGVTPLSVYVTAGLTLITGVEIVAVKVVTSACFAATAVLSDRLARVSGLSSGAALVTVAAVFVWGRPYGNPPYTPMAVTLFLATLVAVVGAVGRSSKWRAQVWILPGVLAGLAFASKQNIGLLAVASAVLGLAVADAPTRRQLRGGAAAIAAGFGASALTVLAPVAVSGGLPALWDYGLVGKAAYLEIGSVSYLGSVAATFGSLAGNGFWSALTAILHDVVLFLPVVVFAVVAVTVRRLDRHDRLLVALAVAATLMAFPRWDQFHMAYAVPVHLIVIGRLVRHLGLFCRPSAGRTVGAAAIAAVTVVVAAQPIGSLVRGGREPLGVAHFHGPLVATDLATELRSSVTSLRSAAGDDPVFVLSSHAGFWYLAAGLSNPTPFDIPARTATGADGIPWLLAALETGRISKVCLASQPSGPQALVEIEAFVRSRFHPGVDAGPCRIFTRP